MPIPSSRRPAPAFRPPICARSIGRDCPRLCSRPACRSRIRPRTGRPALARAAGVEVIGDIELFCRERRHARTDGAVCRHHRHQRQIDHHRAHRAPPALGRPRRPDGRQYRHRNPVARAAGRRPRVRDRVLVLSDRSRADARSVGRHPSQRHRGSSRPSRDAAALRRREGAPRRRGPGGWNRDRRRRRRVVRGGGRPHAACRQAAASGLRAPAAARRPLCRG